MSAIWGYITPTANQFNPQIAQSMADSMNYYKIDRINEKYCDNAYFGCGHQHITNESLNDVSPIYDPDRELYFSGDCFLYNREDIISHLQTLSDFKTLLNNRSPKELGDCQLAYITYQLMGDDFVSLLRGSFTFAIYYIKTSTLHLFSDHLSKRYLAYYVSDELVCFGSTLRPIKTCLKGKLKLSHEFIIRAYRTMSPRTFYIPEMTIYEGVTQLISATHAIIDCKTHTVKKIHYWDPIKQTKKLKGKTDDECKELFLKTYQKIVEAQLRSINETGIMLSGGLDSSSVTAFAAPALKDKGKVLNSYTSVPHPDYEWDRNSWMVEDESLLVEEQHKMHSNLCPHFVSGDDSDCLGTTDIFYKVYDIPVKPSLNNINIDNMCQEAVADGCKILLGAGNGNPTVSYGNISQYISMQFLSGHPIKAFKEMNATCKKYKISRKRYLKAWSSALFRTLTTSPEEFTYYLKERDLKKYNLEHFNRDEQKKLGNEYIVTVRQRNNFLYLPIQYIQRSFFFTSLGLRYGFLQIDPTMTAEIVELCASLPLECFAHDGIERRLINGYMKDLLPPAITDIRKGFGMQAADCAFRVNRNWDQIKDRIYDVLNEPLLREYMDDKELSTLIQTIHENEYNLDANTVTYASLISSLGYFLRDFYSSEYHA